MSSFRRESIISLSKEIVDQTRNDEREFLEVHRTQNNVQ